MSVAESPIREAVEAVIITGPDRGRIITLDPDDTLDSPEIEAMLDEMIACAKRMADSARRIADQTARLADELHAARTSAA